MEAPDPALDRWTALVRPFLELDGRIRARRTVPHYDGQSAILLLLTMGFFVAGMIVVREASLPSSAQGWVAYSGAALSGAGLIWSLATDVRRFMRKKAYPMLAAALLPLAPSPDELDRILQLCRERNLKVGALVDPHRLLKEIEARMPGAA